MNAIQTVLALLMGILRGFLGPPILVLVVRALDYVPLIPDSFVQRVGDMLARLLYPESDAAAKNVGKGLRLLLWPMDPA